MDSDLATFSDIPANYVLAAASCVVAAAVAAFVLLGGKKAAKPYARFPSPRSWVAALKKGARRTEGWLEANAGYTFFRHFDLKLSDGRNMLSHGHYDNGTLYASSRRDYLPPDYV